MFFEQLGFDRLYLDEAHEFKNVFVMTKMKNIAGMGSSTNGFGAEKALDMDMKVQYMNELTNNKGVVFATGTPISNSMVEMYTMMNYLEKPVLEAADINCFDAWAANFGKVINQVEENTQGKFVVRKRFAKFFNLPELMSMFKETADICTKDMLNLPTPKFNNITVVAEPTPVQSTLIKVLDQRAQAIKTRQVTPKEDNYLKLTTDGRKIGLDARLYDSNLTDFPQTKINMCVDNIHKIYQDTAGEKKTQVVFCDFSAPYAKDEDGNSRFNVYEDIKEKLIAKGIPSNEIAFIHDAKNDTQKAAMFKKVNQGAIRIIFGSTPKMGVGTNIQKKLIAAHHLDAPWRPSDVEQRNGRIIRQGNENNEVDIYTYVTNGTFDSYLFQTLENKQIFISQIMTGKSPARSCDDLSTEAMGYAAIKSCTARDPRVKDWMELKQDVERLSYMEADFNSSKYAIQDRFEKYLPRKIKEEQETIQGLEIIKETVIKETHESPEGFSPMSFKYKGENCSVQTKKKSAELQLLRVLHDIPTDNRTYLICEYRGLSLSAGYSIPLSKYVLSLETENSKGVSLSAFLDSLPNKETIAIEEEKVHITQEKMLAKKSGNSKALKELEGKEEELLAKGGEGLGINVIARLNNTIDNIDTRISLSSKALEDYNSELKNLAGKLNSQFEFAEELEEKRARYNRLTVEIGFNENDTSEGEIAYDDNELTSVGKEEEEKSRDTSTMNKEITEDRDFER